MSKISAFVLGHGNYNRSLDEEFDDDESGMYEESTMRIEQSAMKLGTEFAHSGKPMSALGDRLFSADRMPCRLAFGQGLAAGARDKQAMWDGLAGALDQNVAENYDLSVLAGFIEQLDREDRLHAQRILDQCLENPRLSQQLVYLHPLNTLDARDLDRCIRALEVPDVKVQMYGDILWKDPYAVLPAEKLLELAVRILAKSAGEHILLQALAMKLHGKNTDDDVLGVKFRRLGLIAAKNRLLKSLKDHGQTLDRFMKKVLRASLRYGDNEPETNAWFDAIFDVVDRRHGILSSFNESVLLSAELMPYEFLDRVFILMATKGAKGVPTSLSADPIANLSCPASKWKP